MKVEAFVSILRPYASLLANRGAVGLAARINALADVWSPAMSWNVKGLLRKAWPAHQLPEADESSVQDFREALVQLQDVLKAVAKQDQIKDLAAIIEALEPHDKAELESFIKACQLALEAAQASKGKRYSAKMKSASAESVDKDRVASTIARLRETYKNAEIFEPVFEELSSEQGLNQAELAAVASAFAYDTPPTTSRTESLRRIWLVHESYSTSAAKSKASAGKSAA